MTKEQEQDTINKVIKIIGSNRHGTVTIVVIVMPQVQQESPPTRKQRFIELLRQGKSVNYGR